MSRRSNSDLSTGHESGWTMYLDESSASGKWTQKTSRFSVGPEDKQEEAEEEENLSMISDASSGPPHCKFDDSCNDENECSSFFASFGTNASTRHRKQQHKEKHAEENGRKRSTSSSLQEKSEIPNCSRTSSPLIAGKAASGKPGRSKGSRD